MKSFHCVRAAFIGVCFLVLVLSRAVADPWGERDLEKGFADWLGADWIMQDGGNPGTVFVAEEGFEQELAVINKAAEELAEYDRASADEKLAAAKELADADVPANDPRWKETYLDICRQRRIFRLTKSSKISV